MDLRREIECAVISVEGLRGFTSKMEIANQDVYVKVAFHRTGPTEKNPHPECCLVHVDVTLSAAREPDEIMTTHNQTMMETTKTDNARAMIELLCREANTLLQSGVWNEESLAEAWGATRFEPSGLCIFPSEMGDPREGLVLSPLDAIARLIRARIKDWKEKVNNND